MATGRALPDVLKQVRAAKRLEAFSPVGGQSPPYHAGIGVFTTKTQGRQEESHIALSWWLGGGVFAVSSEIGRGGRI